MNFKSLFAVVSIALTLIACDESSSAPAEEVVNPASSETITSSETVAASSESVIASSETAILSSATVNTNITCTGEISFKIKNE